MFELQSLSRSQIQMFENTISSNAFYMIVGDALVSRKPLSVVRMGDGDAYLFHICETSAGLVEAGSDGRYDEAWLRALGCFRIPKLLLFTRLVAAAKECTYFAPSISGIFRHEYDNYSLSFRDCYVDNFFVNEWTREMQAALYRQAGHVLLIHNSAETADSLQINLREKLGVKVTFVKLTRWEETEEVIARATLIDAPLVLFSAGPAGKYIAERIAESGKVVLDIGNSIDHWTLA